jgi:hypothetical protein
MNTSMILGAALLMLGTLTFIVAVFRSMGHSFAFGVYELWVLPVAGMALVLLGGSLVR